MITSRPPLSFENWLGKGYNICSYYRAKANGSNYFNEGVWKPINYFYGGGSTMTDSTRPIWGFDMTEADFCKMNDGIIKYIRHQMKLTGEDSSINWVELSRDGKTWFRLPKNWQKLFQFTDIDHAGLFNMTWEGRRAFAQLEKIRAWERSNASELAEYKRLRSKFGDV